MGIEPLPVLDGLTPPPQPLPPSFPLPGGQNLALSSTLKRSSVTGMCPEYPEYVSWDRHFSITLCQALVLVGCHEGGGR